MGGGEREGREDRLLMEAKADRVLVRSRAWARREAFSPLNSAFSRKRNSREDSAASLSESRDSCTDFRVSTRVRKEDVSSIREDK